MTIDLGEHALGLTTDKLRHVHRLLHDYDPNLSLRRIPDADPILPWALRQDPPRLYGVYEENVGHGAGGMISNWVFTVAEANIDDRVFARVIAGDMQKHGVEERIANQRAFQAATELSAKKKFVDNFEERREEMIWLGKSTKSTVHHRINGEDVVLDSGVHSRRTHIS